MGYYIQTPGIALGKAMYLVNEDEAEIIPQPLAFTDIPADRALICVVNNMAFEAAAYIYREKDMANRPIMETKISGHSALWSHEIWEKWNALWDAPSESAISEANYFTPRPYVDEYNIGSNDEGFTYVTGESYHKSVWQVLVNTGTTDDF